MRRSMMLIAGFVLGTAAACAPATGSRPAPGADGVAWSSFAWIGASFAGQRFEKAAIFLPLTSESLGGTYWLQLDTGADAALWIYEAPLRQLLARRGAPPDSASPVRIEGRIGSYSLAGAPVQRRRLAGDTVRAGDPRPKIGSLGIKFFENRVLLLDLPRARFAILDGAAPLPAWIAERAAWVPADYRNDKMFIPVTLNGRVYPDFFYDSGASLFAVSTTREVWRGVTGRTGGESDNVVWRVPAFGKEVVLVGAPVRGRVAVGAASLERPLAFHLAEGPEDQDFSKWGFPVSGLVGNALFADRYLVIVDLPRRRFGLVESPGA